MRGGSRFYWLAAGAGLLGLLLALAGCGGGYQNWSGAERAAWRTEAESQCIKSGAVKTGSDIARIEPVGNGYCGAEYPLKVAALGIGTTAMGYADVPRPPGAIPSGSMPQWPTSNSNYAPPPPPPGTAAEPRMQWTPGPPPARQPSAPISLAPGSLDELAVGRGSSPPAPTYQPRASAPPAYTPPPTYRAPPPAYEPPQTYRAPQTYEPPQTYRAPQAQPLSGQRPRYEPPRYAPPQHIEEDAEADDIPDDVILPKRGSTPPPRTQPAYTPSPQRETYAPAARPLSGRYEPPRLGPQRNYTPAKVAVTPPATLACPIVSSLDKWVNDGIQPAAMRWFGQPVVEIKQISSYSCRGMVGGSGVSEHAFGNALDVAGFVLADGRKVMVKDGWFGRPEESGFLHDVQGSACQIFNTVLAPGYNVYHYDHFHVDLMRRSSGSTPCRPTPVPGEIAAAKQAQKSKYANRRDPMITGSIGKSSRTARNDKYWSEDRETAGSRGTKIPVAVAGEDGEFDEE